MENPTEAMRVSCERARKGEDTISATGLKIMRKERKERKKRRKRKKNKNKYKANYSPLFSK